MRLHVLKKTNASTYFPAVPKIRLACIMDALECHLCRGSLTLSFPMGLDQGNQGDAGVWSQ